MYNCPNCGNKVAADAVFCPNCGKQKPAQSQGFVLLLFFMFLIVLFLTPSILVRLILFKDAEFWDAVNNAGTSVWGWVGSLVFWLTLLAVYLYLKAKESALQTAIPDVDTPNDHRHGRKSIERTIKKIKQRQTIPAQEPSSAAAIVPISLVQQVPVTQESGQYNSQSPQQGSLKVELLKLQSESGLDVLQATYSGVLNAKQVSHFKNSIDDLIQRCDSNNEKNVIFDFKQLSVRSDPDQKILVEGTDWFIKSIPLYTLAFVSADPRSFASILKRHSILTVFPFHDMCHPHATAAMRWMESVSLQAPAPTTQGQLLTFEYTAMSPNGQEFSGEVNAATEDEAAGKIKAMNLFPMKVTPKQHLGGK
jgi:hypothetical protein